MSSFDIIIYYYVALRFTSILKRSQRNFTKHDLQGNATKKRRPRQMNTKGTQGNQTSKKISMREFVAVPDFVL